MAEGEQQEKGEKAQVAQRTAAGKLDDLQGEWGWFPRFVYKHRVAWWIWPALVVLTAVSGSAGFKLLQWISRLADGDFDKWMQSPGPWTALIVLAGLPGALFVWIVRDSNKATEHWQEQRRLERRKKSERYSTASIFTARWNMPGPISASCRNGSPPATPPCRPPPSTSCARSSWGNPAA